MSAELCLTNIESTVIRICREISITQKQHAWSEMGESDLFFELVNTILGSQVSNELATSAAAKLREEGFLRVPVRRSSYDTLAEKIENTLTHPLFNARWGIVGRKYRFPKLRANQICRTMHNIYGNKNSLKNILETCSSATNARVNLIRSVLGIGPKQASLFLRNIGYAHDLAILDSHVLRYMGIRGMSTLSSPPSTLSIYEETENKLLEHSMALGFSLGCLDQAIWITMRVARKESLI